MSSESFTAGRSCPLSYRYEPASLAQLASVGVDTLYCVGGLYGNPFALDALDRLLETDRTDAKVVFNGDFHWFDATASAFDQIESRTANDRRFTRLRGNVETELASDDDAGCGCAYPDSVDDGVVDRSNEMLRRLRDVSREFPAARTHLASLPMSAAFQVGGQRVVVVHGDLESLAGWRFDPLSLNQVHEQWWAMDAMRAANADIVASSHTCLPALRQWPRNGSSRTRTVVNNGAAGMPCVENTRHGIVTRIGTTSAASNGLAAIYGVKQGDVWVEALALNFEFDAWREHFLSMWPAGSAGHQSYFSRIENGVGFSIDQALGHSL